MLERIVEFSLRHRFFLIILVVLICGLGLRAYLQLPVDAFPDVSPNLVQVFTETEGLAPEEVEQYVTYPIEVVMNGLPGLKEIRSVSNFGLSVVSIFFEDDIDIYFARQLVSERLQGAREQIPEGFGNPQMGPISTGMGLILFYYLEDETGQRSLGELREIQDWVIKYHLQSTPGVTEVLGIGGFEKQYQVIVNPTALLQYNITLHDLVEALRANNLNVGGQFIERNSEEFIVRSVGLVTSLADIENIVVKSYKGTPVYVRQITEVKIGSTLRRGIQTMNGTTEIVAGQVVKLFGTNSSVVIHAVEEKMTEINKILPQGVKIIPYYDQKTLVEACIRTVSTALYEGVVLVIIILFLFMEGIRPSIIVALSIPFSTLFTFILMKHYALSANLMSLGGIAIAIGLLVDGTIVIVENIDQWMRRGNDGISRHNLISGSCREVSRPIVFSIIIIILVFLPLFALEGVEGKMFRPLAYTIAMAMFGSLLFALVFAPVLADMMMKPRRNENAEQKEVFIIRWISRVYQPLLRYLLHRRKSVLTGVSIVFILAVFLFFRLGSEFTPQLQEGTIIVKLTMAPSISLDGSKQTVMMAERLVMEIPEVERVVTRIGRGEIGAHTDPINNAEMYVLFKPKEKWRSARNQEDLVSLIRDHLGEIPGVLLSFTQPIELTIGELLEGIRAELAIKIFGEDLDLLKPRADEVAQILRGIRGAKDIQVDQISGTPQLRISIDRTAIAKYGINVADVQEVLSAAVGGEVVGQLFEGVKRFEILVRFAPEFRSTKDAIGNILIPAHNGSRIPLAQLAAVEEMVGPRQITRENNQRFIAIQCNVEERDIGSFVKEGKRLINQRIKLPPRYFIIWGGQFELQQEANKRMMVVIPVTLMLVFILLFSSFNSLKDSFLVLLNIPFSLVGGIVGLWLTGQNVSVPASIGFIALFGIALGNGMLLITYYNQLLPERIPLRDIIMLGVVRRLRPVLMTALATAFGLLPLLFAEGIGSEVQKPLATVVFGGIFTSTLATLFILPLLYDLLALKARKEQYVTNNLKLM